MDDVRDRIPRGERLWVALVTRRRRPLFVETEVRERVEAAVRAAAESAGWRVACCEVWPAEVRMCVEVPPNLSQRNVVAQVRAGLSAALVKAGHSRGTLARRYVVTTGAVAETACGAD